MSENLSIDEIIKRAEKIKAEADRQLEAASKTLDEKAKNAIDEVTVDEEEVARKIAEAAAKPTADEDIKEYVPPKKQKPSVEKTQEVSLPKKREKSGGRIQFDTSKTKPIALDDDSDMKIADDDVKIVPTVKKSKNPFAKKEKQSPDISKTRRVAFVSNAQKDEKTDLEGIPTIVAKDKVFDNEPEFTGEEIGVQITFDGFDDKIESVPTIDEEVAEQILEQRRQEKVGKFRLFGPDETDKNLGNSEIPGGDYVSKSERETFIQSLLGKRAAVKSKIIATSVLGAILLFLTLFINSSVFPTFLLPPGKAYFITCLVVFAATIAANFNVIVHGFNFKRGINSDFPIAVSAILIAAHIALMIAFDDIWYESHMMTGAFGALALLASQCAKYKMLSRIVDDFEFVSGDGDKYTVENITNNVDSQIIAREFIPADSTIQTSVKADLPTNFLEIECKKEPADKISAILFGVMFLLSGALFVYMLVKYNKELALNTAFTALCVSLPASTAFLTNLMIGDVSSALDIYGSRVCGYEGALMADTADAVVMEAADLFGKDSCDILGIKTFNGAKVDDAIIQAAAVMIQTKSPLADVFDDVIIGKQSILPTVEDITYEDKMGTSAWIYKRKVLVGNRDLLIRHGVNVPKESYEKRYTVKNRKALYLAVGGKVCAMFVVSYSADADLKRELKKLEKSGVTIILKTGDPYINEESVAKLFDLPEGFIRVMNYSAARVYEKYSSLEVEKSPAYIVHNGTAVGFVSAMHGAKVMTGTKSLIAFLVAFGSVIGFGAVAMLAFLGAFSQIGISSVMIFQVVWTAFVALVSKFKSYTI